MSAAVVRSPTPDNLDLAASLIRQGQVVATPTETVYGLAADAWDPGALQAIDVIKGALRNRRPLSILVPSLAAVDAVARDVCELARRLMRQHWPGALTLVLPGNPRLPRRVLNDDGEVALRLSSDPVAAALVNKVGGPVTATSANPSGQPPATSARSAALRGVAMVLDDGDREDLPSTLVRVADQRYKVLRQGRVRLA